MTTESRRRQRVPVIPGRRNTWVALLVLAAVTFAGIPAGRHGGLYWPAALALAHVAIALRYARSRRGDARVLAYAWTAAGLTALFTAAWMVARPHAFPAWAVTLDRAVAPWGAIGVALLVLARLERDAVLLAFALVYLAVVVTPLDPGRPVPAEAAVVYPPQQAVDGAVLLLGAAGFAIADLRDR